MGKPLQACVASKNPIHTRHFNTHTIREAVEALRSLKAPDSALLHQARPYVLGFTAIKSRKAQEQFARNTKSPPMAVQVG